MIINDIKFLLTGQTIFVLGVGRFRTTISRTIRKKINKKLLCNSNISVFPPEICLFFIIFIYFIP